MLPSIKFDELITIDDWAEALRRILDAATEATRNKNAQGRRDLQDLLATFIKRSPAKIELLDVIARETIEDLAIADISASLERISGREAELTRAVGLVTAATTEAKKDARQLKLESTLDALARAKAALDAFSQFEKTVMKPDLTLLQKVQALADALATLTKSVEAAA
jgi:hypothetical protein